MTGMISIVFFFSNLPCNPHLDRGRKRQKNGFLRLRKR
jgi:hypothetical protein